MTFRVSSQPTQLTNLCVTCVWLCVCASTDPVVPFDYFDTVFKSNSAARRWLFAFFARRLVTVVMVVLVREWIAQVRFYVL